MEKEITKFKKYEVSITPITNLVGEIFTQHIVFPLTNIISLCQDYFVFKYDSKDRQVFLTEKFNELKPVQSFLDLPKQPTILRNKQQKDIILSKRNDHHNIYELLK